jgi:hypothetical protein
MRIIQLLAGLIMIWPLLGSEAHSGSDSSEVNEYCGYAPIDPHLPRGLSDKDFDEEFEKILNDVRPLSGTADAAQYDLDHKQYHKAFVEVAPLVERGDAEAQMVLAEMYRFGRGVPRRDLANGT